MRPSSLSFAANLPVAGAPIVPSEAAEQEPKFGECTSEGLQEASAENAALGWRMLPASHGTSPFGPSLEWSLLGSVDRRFRWYALSAPELYGHQEKGSAMGLVLLLLLLALLFGGLGLFVEGLKWALIIALVLVVASLLTGYRGRRLV